VDFYDRTILAPPLISPALTYLLAAGVFSRQDNTSLHDPLAHSVSIYAFCPADPTAPAYAAVLKETNEVSLDAVFNVNKFRAQPQELGRISVVKSVQCVQAGLLSFASMARGLAGCPPTMRPLLSTLCKYMAFQLSNQVLLDKMHCVPALARLQAHFILNEAQRVVSAFCHRASLTATKSAAAAATIPTTTFSVAVSMVAKFKAEVMGLFWQDLMGKILPFTYSEECLPAPVKSVPFPSHAMQATTALAPAAKCSKRSSDTTHGLSPSQLQSTIIIIIIIINSANSRALHLPTTLFLMVRVQKTFAI